MNTNNQKNPFDVKNVQERHVSSNLKRIKKVLLVMSGKGGVGKSSVTSNISSALSKKGYKVGVLDLDLHGPSISTLLKVFKPHSASDDGTRLIPAETENGIKVISLGFMLKDKDSAVMWRGPQKNSAINRFIGEVEWGDLDYLLIDTPPGTGDEHLTLLKIIPNIYSVLVTTPQEVSLADVRKSLNFLKKVNGKVLGIIENMSGLSCPNCGYDISLFKKGGGKLLAKENNILFLGEVPIDPVVVVSADEGTPVVLLPGDYKSKQAFFDIADVIESSV